MYNMLFRCPTNNLAQQDYSANCFKPVQEMDLLYCLDETIFLSNVTIGVFKSQAIRL